MLTTDFKNKKVYLWGTGLEGQAVIEWWNNNMDGQELGIIESDTVPQDAEIIIKSPGVSLYLPQLIEAKQKGCQFTSLMNIFFAGLNAQEKKPITIAVTGTKGKSTTSSLLAYILEHLGFKVGLGGNIGSAPLEFIGKDLDYIVLELSSFQISDLEYDIDYGVIVNISQAHVDWHLSLENYINDKLRILDRVNKIILNGNDERLSKIDNSGFYGKKDGFYVENGAIYDAGERLELPLLQIKGDHNLENLCGVLSVLKELGHDYKSVLPTLKDFEALPHRLQLVYENNGLIFIDDSIATVPDSTMAAINAFDNDIAVIVGGFDNKPDYSKLDDFIANNEKVKVALCLPDTGALIKNSKAIMVKNMQEAVEKAIENLGKGVVLLSPAAPSYNLYNNYKERGNDFKRIAKEVI